MPIQAKFVHTNLIAQDWKKLATFYEQVFGCMPVLPERDLAGQWLDDATRVPNARIRGVHLRLPGYGDAGPTLEIFQYDREEERPGTAVNRPGFAHIAFASMLGTRPANAWPGLQEAIRDGRRSVLCMEQFARGMGQAMESAEHQVARCKSLEQGTRCLRRRT